MSIKLITTLSSTVDKVLYNREGLFEVKENPILANLISEAILSQIRINTCGRFAAGACMKTAMGKL